MIYGDETKEMVKRLVELGPFAKVPDVAEITGLPPQRIRIGLQRGLYPFGEAIDVGGDGRRYTYTIYTNKLIKYVLGE